MTDDFKSTKDKPVVRDVAERLRANGLRVWFDEWEIKPDDNRHREAALFAIKARVAEGRRNALFLRPDVIPTVQRLAYVPQVRD